MENVKKELISAIEKLAAKITGDIRADDALKFTQASLNAAHTIQVLELTKK